LKRSKPVVEARIEEQRSAGIDEGNGIYLTFESEPNFQLKFESLDLASSGIELCAVKTLPDNRMQATLFVPDGKLERFLILLSQKGESEGRGFGRSRLG
jgi:hypothetical protein